MRGDRVWNWKNRSDSDSQKISDDDINHIVRSTGLSSLTARVCLQRGLKNPVEIESFLNPKLENLTSPDRIKDLPQAVDRILKAHELGEPVLVFGDYDVDGTCGAALLGWVFRDFDLKVGLTQPDRFRDGYGLNLRAVNEAHQSGVKLLVTVDCGISSFEAIDRATELGIDVVVVDHHQIDPVRGLPNALAVMDPQRNDCESGLKQLCGCGLAFYLAMGLRAEARRRGWFLKHSKKEPNLRQHLDLVVIATAADQVPLTGDNRILVRHGMDVLKNTKKPGVRALMEAAGISNRSLSPGHLGFVLGPRINASGRMESASHALELLSTVDEFKARELAQLLEKLNSERAEVQGKVWDEVRVRVETDLALGKFKNGIVVADSGWHEGVVGIVASRVTETFQRPAVVISIHGETGKGSVRTFGGKDVLEALRQSSSFLKGFGGHRHAAGLSLDSVNLEAFSEAFDRALAQIESSSEAKTLWLEGTCELDELKVKTLKELESLGPFGPGNPEPVFSIRAHAVVNRVLKGRHLKLSLTSWGKNHQSEAFEAIWFHAAEQPEVQKRLESENEAELEAEWAGVPEINYFRGQMTPTFRVKDWKPSSPKETV